MSSGNVTAPSDKFGTAPVSIVITNYNYARYLRAAIDSALRRLIRQSK